MGTEIENLQNILKEDPSNFQARRELSVLLADNGFNEEALKNLEYLVEYFPEDADLYYNLGILYEKTKSPKKAEKSYKKAISIYPHEDFYYNLGEVLVTLEKWDEAAEAFKEVIKRDSKDGNSYFNLGLCYLHNENIKLATDNLQKAVEINPKDLYAQFYLGNIYMQNGLTNFAEDCFKKVLEISPDYSWAYYNLASIAYGNGNNEQAKRYLRKTIQYNDSDIDAYKLLTKLCIKENDIEDIITILETRLKKEENGDLYYILARVYKYVGNSGDYAKNLQNAIANQLTLTYPKESVLNEYNNIKSSAGEELEPEGKIEEYNSETEEDDIFDEEINEELDDEDDLEEVEEEDEDDDEDDDDDDDEDDEGLEEV